MDWVSGAITECDNGDELLAVLAVAMALNAIVAVSVGGTVPLLRIRSRACRRRGEYPAQDGFGWSNGVALGLLAEEPAY